MTLIEASPPTGLDHILAEALAAQRRGDLAAAAPLFSEILARNPNQPDALQGLGLLDYEQGRLLLALEKLEKAAAINPDAGDIQNNLATIYLGLGRLQEALQAYTRAVALKPDSISFNCNLGLTLTRCGQPEEAAALMQRMLAIRADIAPALSILANAERAQGQLADCLTHYQQALQLTPQDPEAHYNVGVALQDLWRMEESVPFYDTAIALKPGVARYHVNRGAALLKCHRLDEAARAYEHALEIDPAMAEAHYNLAIIRLLQGDIEAGAAHYEWRLKVEETSLSKPRHIEAPDWDGTVQLDKTVLLHSEQGLGDMVQFVRFALAARAMVKRVIVEIPRPLVRIFTDSMPGITFIAKGETPPPFDLQAPLMSLMHRMKLRLDDLPAAPIPYLQAQPERVAKWAKRLENGSRDRRIALVWQGNPKAKVDRGRSIPLARLIPLLALPGLRFISLQKNEGAEQIAALPEALRSRIEILGDDFDAGPDGFVDTLAVMMNCDLVLTTDTAISHIAGALGRPTWLMLKYMPDWRWMFGQPEFATTSPWYPTLRLFRQPTDGNWGDVVSAVAAALLPARAELEVALQQHRAGALDAAEAGYKQALAVDPNNAVARHHLGVIAHQRGQSDIAETYIRAALEIAPDDIDAKANLALVLKVQGRFEEAISLCLQVLHQRPSHDAVHNNLANIMRMLDRAAEALPHYQKAVALQPERAEYVHNLGVALVDLARPQEALAPLGKAVALSPKNADFHFDLARALLTVGAWREGWPEYEWRRAMPEFGKVSEPASPRWTGEANPALTLLVHAEQGLGDTLQFARFVEAARARVGHLILVVQPRLMALARSVAGADEVYTFGEELPVYGAQIPLLSLPLVLGITPATLPTKLPYLAASEKAKTRWKKWRKAHPGFLVGLNWQGNPSARADAGRSLKLEQLKALGDIPGVTFVALQKGAAVEQIGQLSPGFPLLVPDEPFDEGDQAFVDTAALIGQLDMVLTTDTSVAHLAGALGRPTWVMLKYVPDWRWGLGSITTPWYPGMHLFRQSRAGDWDGVVAAVRQALQTRIESGKADTTETDYVRAVALHQAGKIEAAAALYTKILTLHPEHVEARHYLGLARYQQGSFVEAEALLKEAVIKLPDSAEAWGNLALAYKGQAKMAESRQAFEKSLQLNPNSADVHNNFGNLLTGGKNFTEAEGHYREAIRLMPNRPDSYHNLGNALGDLERFEEAIENYRRAIALRPDYVGALNGLGKAYHQLKRFSEAEAAFREAIALDAKGADAWSNLGVIYRELGRHEEAFKAYEEAIARAPTHAEAWGNKALALHMANRLPESEAAYREASRLKPDRADSQFGLAAVLLTQGRWSEGWPQYEWRRKIREMGPLRGFARPLWNGETAPDKTLFLFVEQGLGDTLQFIRFAKAARARVGRIVVEVQPALKRLLAGIEGVDELLPQGEKIPPFDFYLPLMSLPRVLGVTVENLQAPPHYLQAEPEKIAEWREKLKPDGRLLIGLNWQGNPKAAVDKGRSVPLAQLTPLLEQDGVRFICLQKNDGLEQITALPQHLQNRIEQLGDGFDAGKDAFIDSAAVMANLNIVITSDTAMAHLAGALGVPGWIMLKFMPDWRWLTERTDCPWYPAHRLFRQPAEGNWTDVAAQLTAALREETGMR